MMVDPIISTLSLGGKDELLETLNQQQENDRKLAIISLQANKELPIPDKARIISEITENSEKQKNPL